ncbi:MAG: putative transposase, partial [Myxococcota bacterium]
DKKGHLPRFLQWFNSLLARAVNCADDQREAVWSKASTDVEWVPSAAAVMQKLAYIAANPVSAGAVRHGRDWPGARSNAQMFGKPRRIRRPHFFFGDRSCLPQAPHLHLTQPPTHAHLTPAAFRAALADAIHRAESAARESREKAGLTFQGPKSCLKADPMWVPSTNKDASGTPAPVSEPDPDLRAASLEEVAGFREAYAETLARWQSGRCDVKWPKGTWKLVHILRVPFCRATPARAAPK